MNAVNSIKSNFKVTIPLAIVMTLVAVIYQRTTGPTYPKRVELVASESKTAKIKLPRSQGGSINAPVELPKITKEMSATITYKRYPTNDVWTTAPLVDEGNRLTFGLPNQPPAGKLTYFIDINYGNGKMQSISTKSDPIYIRYKGDVPTFILAPHIFFMFFSMLLSALAFFEVLFKTNSYLKIGGATLVCLMFGGMVLGPIVQKYAFGVYWAGFPYDWDLTDNKLLVGVLAWLFGFGASYLLKKRWPTLIAALILFAVYSIPHSMQGSEFNYETNTVETDLD